MNKVASMSLKCRLFDKTEQTKENTRSMAIIRSLYKAYGQKDKRCAERYTIFQPRIKSWTSTIIWDKYNAILFYFIFLVNYVSGTSAQQDLEQHPESPRTVFNSFFRISSFVFSRTKTFIQVWNYLRLSKWWQNFHFWVNYPFKTPSTLMLMLLVHKIIIV